MPLPGVGSLGVIPAREKAVRTIRFYDCSFLIELSGLLPTVRWHGRSAGRITTNSTPWNAKWWRFSWTGCGCWACPDRSGKSTGCCSFLASRLSLDDLVRSLNISKGSASQGLRMLKSLGAVREADGNGSAERRTYYEPAVELKRLVGGFIREQVRPHLESGKTKISRLAETARDIEDPEQRKFLSDRVERLEQWMRSGGKVLPVLQKILGQ